MKKPNVNNNNVLGNPVCSQLLSKTKKTLDSIKLSYKFKKFINNNTTEKRNKRKKES